MTFEEIVDLINVNIGEDIIIDMDLKSTPQSIIISPEHLLETCDFLYENSHTYFDSLSCLTGLDNGPEANTMEVIYNLYSIPFNHHLMIKVVLERNNSSDSLPQIPTVCHIWKTANWHEREAYDLLGVNFTGHPDLRRILLPADWEGYPLRKDYKNMEAYHGIKVD